MQIIGPVSNAVVVRLQIHVKHLVCVLAILSQTRQHVLRAKVRQRWIVDLDVPETLSVECLELLPVRSSKIGEECLVVRVDLLGVALAGSETKVEVAWWRHGELALFPLLLRYDVPQQLPVVKVGACVVLDLPITDSSHGILLASLLQGGNGCSRQSGQVPRHRTDLLEAIELFKETGEVVLAVKLARA